MAGKNNYLYLTTSSFPGRMKIICGNPVYKTPASRDNDLATALHASSDLQTVAPQYLNELLRVGFNRFFSFGSHYDLSKTIWIYRNLGIQCSIKVLEAVPLLGVTPSQSCGLVRRIVKDYSCFSHYGYMKIDGYMKSHYVQIASIA